MIMVARIAQDLHREIGLPPILTQELQEELRTLEQILSFPVWTVMNRMVQAVNTS